MNWRIPLAMVGTAAAYALLQAAAVFLLPEPQPAPGQAPDLLASTAITAAIMFVAVAFGTWIARGRFLLAALALWVVPMGLAGWVAYRITLAAQPIGVAAYTLQYAAANGLLLVATLGAVLAGVAVGRATVPSTKP